MLKGKVFHNVFIMDDRSYRSAFSSRYNPQTDLVLTFDFGLHHDVKKLGGEVHYVDHLMPADLMHAENFNIYKYFNNWHVDSSGKDIFNYRGLDFGFVFRQEIWNDFTYSIRLWLTLNALNDVSYQKMFVGSLDTPLLNVLKAKKISFESLQTNETSKTYFFPMGRWMDEAIRPTNLKAKIRNFLYFVVPWIIYFLEKINVLGSKKPLVFIQNYHPTRAIVEKVKQEGKLTVCLERFSNYGSLQSYLQERPIPLRGRYSSYAKDAEALMSAFEQRKVSRLVLTNGEDVTDFIVEIIVKRLRPRLTYYLSLIDSITNYFSKQNFKLEVIITNVGIFTGLLHSYCQKNKIPNYLILNGLLAEDFMDESKYAMVINSYSTSIKEKYFHGMNNIVVLGDPRMDNYVNLPKKKINRKKPTITIGSSNFNNIDLNSFSAAEFVFLHDVLTVLRKEIANKREIEIVLKVRANGYKFQYVNFVNEFFSDLKIEILDTVPMSQVLQKTDFYLTIYSQTLFEASALGIPVVYYKKDVEIKQAPFDQKSELVSPTNIEELQKVVEAFFKEESIFDAFLDHKVMEKYVGPLDGKNLDRNVDFINSLVKCNSESDVQKLIESSQVC